MAAGGQEAGVPPCQAHTGGDAGGGRVWAGGAGQGPRPHGERLHQGGRQDAQVSLLGIRAPGRVNILATNHQERKCKRLRIQHKRFLRELQFFLISQLDDCS